MGAKDKEVDWPSCQLMLVIEPGPGAREQLQAALDAAPIAAVLLRPKQGDQLGGGETKPLVDLAQAHGAAAILFDDIDLAKTLRADGVHVPAGLDIPEQVAAARSVLGDDATIGVDAGTSRHHAMEAGEAGAAYVAFGVIDGTVDGRTQRDALLEWWAEIFEIPSVALDLESAEDVVLASSFGADFAGLSIRPGQSTDDVAALVGAADMQLLQRT